MIKDENKKIRKIDEMILEKLRKNLTLNKEKIDIIDREKIEKVFCLLEEKKEIIYLLFKGDFSVNEKNIERALSVYKLKTTMYDTIANGFILKRVNEVIDLIVDKNSEDNRIISVCYDRKFFIKRIIERNVDIAFVQKYIPEEEKTIEL